MMRFRNIDLTEEAVGFGCPVLKSRLQTYFPGEIELNLLQGGPKWRMTATYSINLIEKISKPGGASVDNKLLTTIKLILSALIRHFPPARRLLTNLSSVVRSLFGWSTTYEKVELSNQVIMMYTFDEQTGILGVETGVSNLIKEDITEVVIMNELGAHYFDAYSDSSGTNLSGDKIGCWDEVKATDATFSSSSQNITFSLPNVHCARLFRGRELIGNRLAWAGFGYSFPPTIGRFCYSVKIKVSK